MAHVTQQIVLLQGVHISSTPVYLIRAELSFHRACVTVGKENARDAIIIGTEGNVEVRSFALNVALVRKHLRYS